MEVEVKVAAAAVEEEGGEDGGRRQRQHWEKGLVMFMFTCTWQARWLTIFQT